MDTAGKRILGSLILLLGLSLLAAGLASGQLNDLFEFIKKVFEPALAGAP